MGYLEIHVSVGTFAFIRCLYPLLRPWQVYPIIGNLLFSKLQIDSTSMCMSNSFDPTTV